MSAEHRTQEDDSLGGGVPPGPVLADGVSKVERCAGCHRPLTRRGHRGECLRCALGLALAESADPGSDSSVREPRTSPSARSASPRAVVSLHYRHFEVALGADGEPVELGSGAMATTYRATDTTLRLPVALKVISRNVAGRPAARARFLREARAAARLHHPNVASVTFHGEQDGECFYAMELVEGETLAERVRRAGPLSPTQALEVGVQVARALAAAEACGVVHRDLKPSNLMLVNVPGPPTGDLHVKVIDWGLAKAVNADAGDALFGADQTRDAFVGTPAFASPEQFARGAGERRVDVRSDIYSLGVTLWYLLCGKTPFVGDTLEAIHARQQILPVEQLRAARVPASPAGVLTRMLAFDPAARPQSARELLDALRHCQECCRARQPARVRRRRLLQVVVACALLTLGVGGWWLRRPPATPHVTGGRPSLAVLPFENLSPDPANAFFTTGVQQEVSGALERTTALNVVSTEGMRIGADRPRDLASIGRELGVRYLLEGSVHRQDKDLDVSVRLVDLQLLQPVWNRQYARRLDEVFATVGEIALAVTGRLGVALTGAEEAAVSRPPTKNLAAYEQYLRVHECGPVPLNQKQMHDYLTENKVPALERAVAQDPQFVAALCDLADAYDQLAFWEIIGRQAEAAADHRAQAEAALASARRWRPDAGEVHLAQARHLSDFGSNYGQALVELDLARRELPNSAPLESTTAQVMRLLNRWDDAVHGFERAVTLEPNNNGRRWELAATYLCLRRYDDADRELNRALATLPAAERLALRGHQALGKLERSATLGPLRELLTTAKPTDTTYRYLMVRYGLLDAAFSRDPAAIEKALALSKEPWLTFGFDSFPATWFRAMAARMTHDDAAATAAFGVARREVELAVQGDAKNSRALGLLAMIDAGLGRKEEAVREALHACELAPLQTAAMHAPSAACKLAVVYAWTNQPDLACKTLEAWIGRPAGHSWPRQPTYGDFKLNPVWDPLRGYPRFEALVTRLAPSSAP